MKKQEWKFWARMFENAPQMSSEIMQSWIDNPKSLRRFLSGLVPNENRTTPMVQFLVTPEEVNPYDFFVIKCRGMCILWDSEKYFNQFASKKNIFTDTAIIGYIELKKSATNLEIMPELPKGFVFEDFDTLLVYLATIITFQQKCKVGALDYRRPNIFYVRIGDSVFNFIVFWDTDYSEWNIGMSKEVKYAIQGGSRVFSAAVA